MEELMRKIELIKRTQQEDSIILEATVATGLESVAREEILKKELANRDQVCFVPGRVYFVIPVENFESVKSLRSIDNINLVVGVIPDLKFTKQKEQDLKEIVGLLDEIDILHFMKPWALISEFPGNIEPNQQEHDEARLKQDKIFNAKKENIEINAEELELKHNILKFRITCERIGDNHSFSSNEAAYCFGGEVNNRYRWIVALSDWDLNIFLRINDNYAMLCLKVTVKSLHRRCLVDFGPTSLRPTISYGLLALAKLKPGEHMVDPLCGSGSIPTECIYAFPYVIVSCGDIHHRAVERTWKNISAQDTKFPKPEIFTWDAAHLPFEDHSIDAIVTDLPFGKRSGRRKDNFDLYKKLMTEFARVVKPITGRVVLLTNDTPHLYIALGVKMPDSPWHISHVSLVNVGALKCTLIVALRKDMSDPVYYREL